MIYIVYFVVFFLFAFLFDYLNLKISTKIFWHISFLMIVCLVSFRYKLGGDSFNYIRDFESFPILSELELNLFVGNKYAPLCILFFSFFKTIYNDFISVQIAHALIVNSVIFWFFNRYSIFKFYCLLFYFFYFYLYFNTEILRESLAISFFLLSVPSFLSSNWKKYYLLVFVSLLFHYSALILFLFPLFKLKINLAKLYFIFITLVIILPPLILDFLPPIIKTYYEEYIVFKPNINGYIYITTCFVLFPLLLLKLKYKYGDKYFVFNQFVPVFFLISLCAYVIPSPAMRFYNYLLPICTVFFMGLISDLISKKSVRNFAFYLIVPIVIGFKSSEYFTDTSAAQYNSRLYHIWYPYTSIFTKNEKWQIDAVDKRSKWAEAHFENVFDELQDLVL